MGNIVVIGPRASGKTTYLAALAYLPALRSQKGKDSNFKIQPLNDESRNLAENAENIIVEGATFEPTGGSIEGVDDLPYYSFQLQVKKKIFNKPENIQINVRDYPGEVFEKIADRNLSDAIHQEFIDECLMKDVSGCLILFTQWEHGTDKFYYRVMSQFIKLMDEKQRTHDLKLAVVMSKCERGELWAGRIDPETDLFSIHLPRTKTVLKDSIKPANLRFYALSTFGVLHKNDPRPNRIDQAGANGTESVLREPNSWQPYNLIEPLYWLSKD
jgi:Double-GTPase 1